MKDSNILPNSAIRQSNFELLRIFCMLMIITGHLCIVHENNDFLDENILSITRCFTMCAVNCFVILSGFFSIRFKVDRILKLIFQTTFYSVIMFTLSILLGWHFILPIKDFLIVLPIFSNQYWFITAYFLLYLLSPLLNKACHSLSKGQHRFLLIMGGILFYVWPTLAYLVNANQLISDAGYGLINFSYLYMLGRYLRIHSTLIHRAKTYLFVFLTACLSLYAVHKGLTIFLGFPFTSFYSYNTVFVLIAAISLFLLFSKISVQSSAINNLAKSCLAVYLIHCSPFIWTPFCSNLLHIQDYHDLDLVPLLIIVPPVIYFFSHIIEKVRLGIFGAFEEFFIKKIKKLGITKIIENHYESL